LRPTNGGRAVSGAAGRKVNARSKQASASGARYNVTTSVPTQVLIIGAGPTGLVLALWLAKLGVRLRIIDKVAEPGTTSRAIAIQARTLEFYRQLGLADAVVERGLKFAAVNLWAAG